MLLPNFTGSVSGLITRCVVRNSFRDSFIYYMESKGRSAYEEAVYALNGLQSNSAVLQKAREERSAKAYLSVLNTKRHLKTLGVTLEDLDSLNIIHVAGTKGKGSTCAFAESILRKHGFKTGFYSSPHLISVNERIRIDGKPISKELFTEYFWNVYRCIQQSLVDDEPMPPYFLFLTVMAFYVFVREQVNAAVIEVGIGGIWDCTNIVQNPVAVGVTTLGLDHVSILGSTIAEIAEQKAGIFKSNVPAFTVPQQDNAMKVLRDKAQAIGCPLLLSPPLEAYEETVALGVQGVVQNINASLALQLTNTWLKRKNRSAQCLKTLNQSFDNSFESNESSHNPLSVADTFHISPIMQDALENCVWPGRFHTVEKGRMTFYLDGAHTQQSVRHCARWFEDLSQMQRSKYEGTVLRVLLFNCTGERKSESLLDPLSDIHFDLVMFSPNRIRVMKDASSDLTNFMVDPEREIQQCVENREIWCHLMSSLHENELSMCSVNSSPLKSKTGSFCRVDNTLQFPSISDALGFVSRSENGTCKKDLSPLTELVTGASHLQILVTGSLHLVGGVLSLIEN